MNVVATNKVRTPSAGLKILEKLYKDNPHHHGILNSLINAYIRLGFHDNATKLIKKNYGNKQDIQSLKFQAWLAHTQGDIEQERAIWDTILDRTYLAQVHSPIGTLLLRSHRPVNLKPSDIPLISVVRNEMLRLPFFLEYYRKLGVTQFIFVDNNSDDGSFEFLLDQPDCHVYWTNDSYTQAGSGMIWVKHLLNNICYENQWCIHADADEYLVYPFCEIVQIPNLASYLESKGYETLPSFMLDMFPKSIKESMDIDSNDNLIEKSPYFLNNYNSCYQIYCPYTRPYGGIFNQLGIRTSVLTKTGLFKNKSNFNFISATHYSTPAKTSNITSAYLHFKLLGDFQTNSERILREKEHYGGAIIYRDYIRLSQKMDEYSSFLNLPHITKYKNSQQLIDLGLIQTTDEWDKISSTGEV